MDNTQKLIRIGRAKGICFFFKAFRYELSLL
jgi:hypothetical protein